MRTYRNTIPSPFVPRYTFCTTFEKIGWILLQINVVLQAACFYLRRNDMAQYLLCV
jgi:hypothetical protein